MSSGDDDLGCRVRTFCFLEHRKNGCCGGGGAGGSRARRVIPHSIHRLIAFAVFVGIIVVIIIIVVVVLVLGVFIVVGHFPTALEHGGGAVSSTVPTDG